ncbi:Glycosyl transferase, group 2 family protein/polysaccharide deacetylase family protein [Thermofilum adornatum 1505]|uniref:Glycosyl transferase, group 2 family protein/polysaccharide deacetylase family protein n=1 Tax=Thermofilum adornatum 1505 TaxID=697581 RepID=A0A3G1A668_9CREN|nr:glycosyltransferase family 2 protein [Thermofilum adornatum]AJB42402.1 Glycosyl transferase, group 2 family protein/polysaccharide deacetylase family protein [Thermofilum adornatum 1505]
MSHPKLSVIITVYREAKTLPRLLSQLSRQKTSFPYEIIVMIDEPADKIISTLIEEYRGRNVRFDVSHVRRGKVSALNTAIGLARGDVLVFLDNDVEIRDEFFLEKINRWMEKFDIAEIKKKIHIDSFLSRLVYYDYVSFGVASYIFEKHVKRCAGLNGAAMALTRKAIKDLGGFKNCILEDMDIGFRSYFTGYPFKYIFDTEVIVYSPHSIREWLNQRMRWSVGAWLWIREHLFHFAYAGNRHNVVESLAALFAMFPGSIFFASMFFASDTPLVKTLPFVLSLFGGLIAPVIPIMTIFEMFTSLLPPFIFVFLVLLVLYSLLVLPISVKLGFQVHLVNFLLYLFVYSPLWFSVLIAAFIRVFIFQKKDISGWKI